MKINHQIIFIFLTILLFSCSKDDVDYGLGEYEVQLANVRIIDNQVAFLLDNGQLLYNTIPDASWDLKENDRVYINYSILPQSTPNFDQTIRINGLNSILHHQLQTANSEHITNLPDDPIIFQSAWIGSHYLNMMFSFEYKSQPHKIHLVTNSSKLNDNTIYIEFKHDKNNDEPGYKSKIITSFDLEKVLGSPKGNKKLVLYINSTNYEKKTFEFIY